MVNLGIAPYIGSKLVVLMGFGLVQCFALMLVIALKVEYPSRGVFLPAPLEMYISLILAMLVGISLGLFISTVVKNSNMVIYLILVVLFVQIIFSGVLFPLPSGTKALSALTPTRWAMEGSGTSVNMDHLNSLSQQYIEDIDGMPVDKTVSSEVSFHTNYDRSFLHLTGTWLLQLFFSAVLIGGTGLLLKRQDPGQQLRGA